MARPIIDLNGRRFGRLVVVEFVERSEGRTRWACACDCGAAIVARADHIKSGEIRSCGCSHIGAKPHRRTHGMKGTPEYSVWQSVLGRCTRPTNSGFPRYGARGVSVCDRWRSFENFYADMGPRPSLKHSIDRIDPYGNYEPKNCRWVTSDVQAANKRCRKVVAYKGREMPLIEAVAMAGGGVTRRVAAARLKNGWRVDRAVEEPIPVAA